MPRARSSSVATRILLGCAILAMEFTALEAALRLHSGSEAAPGFQSLFVQDDEVGHRLRPGARTRYTTDEFSTDLAINAQGVRDDQDIGPKAPGERRVLVVGDSLVMAVQAPLAQTFGKRLEARLNARESGDHWRVINGGVQGYGPVEDWFFYRDIGAAFDPDVVLVVVSVGNDAVEAADAEDRLNGVAAPSHEVAVTGLRRVVRSSMVLQLARVRWDQLRSRFTSHTVERPLATYLDDPPPFVPHGLDVARRAFGLIADRAAQSGARVAFVLMPTRFQTDDGDYSRLAEITAQLGGRLVRDAATTRFRDAIAPLGRPVLDLLPALAAQPNREGLFFQHNVHLTPRGHQVVADALFDFLQTHGLLVPAAH